ncbi:MAG TPA: GIY-YIG nuclease family protein [Acidobacteriaceae bacterium]|nr:GIY-YIG nuclease family protein [Acidobacteriaceae bacterium]
MSGSYIYILGSHTGTLYIGVTSNPYLRVMQHKEGTWEGFTAAYGCKRLLYFEGYEDLRWLKSSQRHRQDRHPRGPSTPRHQARCHAKNL